MPQLFDPKTFSYEQAAQLQNVPGKSLAETNTQQQLTAAGSLQGTMTSSSGTGTGQPVSTGVNQTPTMNLGLFARAMNEMRTKLAQNQDLIDQKNKLLMQLYDRPLTPEEKVTLTPSQQRAIEANDINLVQMEVRLLNDTLQGRTNTLDQSIKYFTETYQQDIENAQKQYQQSFDTILDYSKLTGGAPGQVARALGYGEDIAGKLDALAAPTTNLEFRDLGDRLVGLDAKGNIVKSYAKGLSPSAGTKIITDTRTGAKYLYNQETGQLESIFGDTTSVGQIVDKKTGAPVKLTDAQSQFFGQGLYLQDTVKQIEDILNNVNTGAVKGWVTEKGYLVPIVQNQLDPDQMNLMQLMYSLNNLFVYFSTGKQINETEFDRLSKQTPNFKATPQYNKSALKNFSDMITARMQNYLTVNGWKMAGVGTGTENKSSKPASMQTPDGKIYDLQSDGTYKLRK